LEGWKISSNKLDLPDFHRQIQSSLWTSQTLVTSKAGENHLYESLAAPKKEDTLNIDLWISIALAIPLAIVANLFTPKLQRWLDARLERSKKAKIEKKEAARQLQLYNLRKELLEVSKYHDNKNELNQLFLVSLIKVAMYGAIGTIYGITFPFMGDLTSLNGVSGIMARTGAQITALTVSMFIFMTCTQAMRVHKKVRDFEEYEKNTKSIIAKLEIKNYGE